jgi:protein-S-isoprenylcysteine O-methyltransferase Ste14
VRAFKARRSPLGFGDNAKLGHGSMWRAAIAFLLLPGTVALVIPLLLLPPNARVHVASLPFFVIGTALLLWCVRDFYVTGKGSLAPWSPPVHLVCVGLYRVSRNPMYIAVFLILCGWGIAFGTRGLWIYAVVVAVMFHLRVVLYEEPRLARMHGDEWVAYRTHVPRWFGLSSSVRRRDR